MQNKHLPFFQKAPQSFNCDICQETPTRLIRLSCDHLTCFICALKQILDTDACEEISFQDITCETCGVKTELIEDVQDCLINYFEELDNDGEGSVSVIEEVAEEIESSLVENESKTDFIEKKRERKNSEEENFLGLEEKIENLEENKEEGLEESFGREIEGVKEKDCVFGMKMINTVDEIDCDDSGVDFDEFEKIEDCLNKHFEQEKEVIKEENKEVIKEEISLKINLDAVKDNKSLNECLGNKMSCKDNNKTIMNKEPERNIYVDKEETNNKEKPKTKPKLKDQIKMNKSSKKLIKNLLKKNKKDKSGKIKTKRKKTLEKSFSQLFSDSFLESVNTLNDRFKEAPEKTNIVCCVHNEPAIYYSPSNFDIFCPNCILAKNINPNKELRIIKNSFSFILNQFSQVTNDFQTKWNIFLAKDKEYSASKKHLNNKITNISKISSLFFDRVIDFCKEEKNKMNLFFEEIKRDFSKRTGLFDKEIDSVRKNFKTMADELTSIVKKDKTDKNKVFSYFFKNAKKLENYEYISNFTKASSELENNIIELDKLSTERTSRIGEVIQKTIRAEVKTNLNSIAESFKTTKNLKSKKLFDFLKSKFSSKETLKSTLTRTNNNTQQLKFENLIKNSDNDFSVKEKDSLTSNIYNKKYFDSSVSRPFHKNTKNSITNISVNKRSLLDYKRIFEKKRSNGNSKFLLESRINSEQHLFKTEKEFSERGVLRTGYLRKDFREGSRNSSLDNQNSFKFYNSNKTLDFKKDNSRELDNVQRKIDVFKSKVKRDAVKGKYSEDVDIYNRRFRENDFDLF